MRIVVVMAAWCVIWLLAALVTAFLPHAYGLPWYFYAAMCGYNVVEVAVRIMRLHGQIRL